LVGGENDNISEDIRINYLQEEDMQLINSEKVIKYVKEYVSNYNGEPYRKYKKDFLNLYQKYSNKRYEIKEMGQYITVYKSMIMGNDKKMRDINKREIILQLKKPTYIYITGDNDLEILKRKISNSRINLQFEYQRLVNRIEVLPEEKTLFEKEKKNFINLLEKYYIYDTYYRTVNNINVTNKLNIRYQNQIEYINENSEKRNILQSEIYSIDKKIVDDINNINADKLNQYNSLIIKLKGIKNLKDNKKIKDEIKNYLDRKNIETITNEVLKEMKKQDMYVNYIVNFD
jgi:hypothetical protein